MSGEPARLPAFGLTTAAPPAPTAWSWLRRGENLLVVLPLTVMVALPCLEILLRTLFHSGVPASAPIVQHLVLVVGMFGGALAARENRLLALSTVTSRFRGRLKSSARIFSNGFAAAVCAFLCWASKEFVVSQRGLGRELAYGIPLWTVQSVLTIGFALVTIRLLWHAGATWRGRLVALALAGGLAALAAWSPIPAEKLRVPGLALLLLATALGAPVFTALGGAALILLWSGGDPIASIPLNHYRLTTNPTLPSIPLFTLAGYFLAEGGAAKRLVKVFDALFGHLRGGPAVGTVLVCAFFTSLTGGSGVTILALGGLLLPILVAAGYSERTSLGLLTGAGSLGLLFPPCLPPILYSIVASGAGRTSVPIDKIFEGGLLPGLLLMGMTAWWGMRQAPKDATAKRRFDAQVAGAAMWGAKWELLIPVVALAALFGGFATPVEAAALTAFYAFLCEVVIYHDLKWFRDVPRVMTACGALVGGVLLILGVALGFTHYLVDAQIPDQAVAWATTTIKSKWLFLLCLNLVLLVIGGLVEIYAAIVVVVPLLVPVGEAFGLDPIHLGIIFLANMELAFLAPPIGLNLLLSSYRFGKPMSEVTRAALPMMLVLLIGVLLITYFPPLTTALPHWLK
jgi:tripartite ATP-independent transporter DctM subunit